MKENKCWLPSFKEAASSMHGLYEKYAEEKGESCIIK